MPLILGETVVRFGNGDIEIGTIRPENGCLDYGLAFRQKEPGEIGEENPAPVGKSTDELGCFLRFEFTNEKSVKVLMEKLERVRMALSGDD